jgi:hypothetical protein
LTTWLHLYNHHRYHTAIGCPPIGASATYRGTTPSAPALYVRVLSFFGTVDVWHVPAEMKGDYGEIFQQLKQQQRQLDP